MRFIRLFLVIGATVMFIGACNSAQTEDVSYTTPTENEDSVNEIVSGENPNWARENLDLQRVGNLLEKADNAEDFEYLLNSDEGINNLDLNGDGYTDYLSVSEFDDRSDNQRGFTIFDRFGPDEIQEVARLFFDRDSNNDPGARVLLTGNEQIYGDGYNYETNWLDKSLAIANWAFGNRDDYYQSPYYYDNYPNDYETYRVVETPVYQARVEEYYPQPVFVQTVTPAIRQININSQYRDKSANEIYARLAKPTREQIKFKKNNPNLPQFVPSEKLKIKKTKSEVDERRGKSEIKVEKREKFEKRDARDNEKFERGNFEKRNNGVRKAENIDRGKMRVGKPEKFERQMMKVNKPNKSERQMMKSNKPNKAEKQMMKANKPEKFERQMMKANKPNKAEKKGNGRGDNGGGNGNGKGKGGGKKGKN